MPVFCSLLLPSYYSNNFAGKINASLEMSDHANLFAVAVLKDGLQLATYGHMP